MGVTQSTMAEPPLWGGSAQASNPAVIPPGTLEAPRGQKDAPSDATKRQKFQANISLRSTSSTVLMSISRRQLRPLKHRARPFACHNGGIYSSRHLLEAMMW